MYVKAAQRGEKVQIRNTHHIVGVALEHLNKGDFAEYDETVLFPVEVHGFLKLLPGVKRAT